MQNWKRIGNPKTALRIYGGDVGMEFGKEKCAMLIMKSGKRLMMEEMELPNQKKKKNQNVWSKRNLQILGNIWSGHHQTCGDEKKTPGE